MEENKKKKINGKAKGSLFEREICKKLEEITGVKWERTFRSGGGKVKGDINPVNRVNPFCIELKNRQSWSVDQFLSECKEVDKWWTKICEECSNFEAPMLILKRNRLPALVMVSRKLFLGGHFSIQFFKEVPEFFISYKDQMIFLFDDLKISTLKKLVLGE